MLAGQTRIELTDVHTGQKEIVEKHNLVTNALRDIFEPLGLSKSAEKYFQTYVPYYATFLGGLLCFDKALPEEPDSYFPPADVHLTACAAYGTQNNTTNTYRGGFNQTESEVNLKERYVKYVYDFSTSQANGTIASVCLTHKNGGYTSYGGKDTVPVSNIPLLIDIAQDTLQYVRKDSTGAQTASKGGGMEFGKTENIFLIDRKQDRAYYFKITDSTHITITKRRLFLKSVSVLDNPFTTKPLMEQKELPALTSEIKSAGWNYNYDPAEDCLYICSSENGRSIKAEDKILVTKIKVDTWEVTQTEVANTSTVELQSAEEKPFVTNGYLYMRAYAEPHDVYRFNLTNSNAEKLTLTGAGKIDAVPRFAVNGRIYFESTGQVLIANTDSKELLPPEQKTLRGDAGYWPTPVRNEPLLYYFDNGNYYASGGWYLLCNYLATVNNLESPVTKTPDKTMKITYTLREEERG